MALTLETIRRTVLTSLFGRRLGLDKDEFLVGHKDQRSVIQDLTSATTATAVLNYGISRVMTSGSTSLSQFILDPPAVGVSKWLILGGTAGSSSTGNQQFFLSGVSGSTAVGSLVFSASQGTSSPWINLRGPSAYVKLKGVSTAQWMVVSQSGFSTTASDNTVSFTTTT